MDTLINLYFLGYAIVVIGLFIGHGYEREKNGFRTTMSEQAWNRLLAFFLEALVWPIGVAYYIPVYTGVLLRKVAKGAPLPKVGG